MALDVAAERALAAVAPPHRPLQLAGLLGLRAFAVVLLGLCPRTPWPRTCRWRAPRPSGRGSVSPQGGGVGG